MNNFSNSNAEKKEEESLRLQESGFQMKSVSDSIGYFLSTFF